MAASLVPSSRDDEIGLLELAAWVCGRQKELDGASGKGGSFAGLSEVRQCLDGSDSPVSLFLAETVNRVSFCLRK